MIKLSVRIEEEDAEEEAMGELSGRSDLVFHVLEIKDGIEEYC